MPIIKKALQPKITRDTHRSKWKLAKKSAIILVINDVINLK